jgi:hypothetical protein
MSSSGAANDAWMQCPWPWWPREIGNGGSRFFFFILLFLLLLPNE